MTKRRVAPTMNHLKMKKNNPSNHLKEKSRNLTLKVMMNPHTFPRRRKPQAQKRRLLPLRKEFLQVNLPKLKRLLKSHQVVQEAGVVADSKVNPLPNVLHIKHWPI